MKRLSSSIIFTLLIFIALPCIGSYATDYGNHSGTAAKNLVDNFNRKYGGTFGNFPYSITDGNNTYYADDDIALARRHMIVYGNAQAVLENPQYTQGISPQGQVGGQWRYIGLIKSSGNIFPVTNSDFPPDSEDGGWYWPTTDPQTCHWNKESWSIPGSSITPPAINDKYQWADDANEWIWKAIHQENIAKVGADADTRFWNETKFNPANTAIYEAPNNYFAIFSPWTEYTGFQCIGWQNTSKGWHYKDFVLPPKPIVPCDLKVEIVSNTFSASTNTYTATVNATIVGDPGDHLPYNAVPIYVNFRAMVKDGSGNWVPQAQGWNPNGLTDAQRQMTITKISDGPQPFTFTYSGTAGQLLKLEAVINLPTPSVDANSEPINPPLDPYNSANDTRAVPESDYSNNVNYYYNGANLKVEIIDKGCTSGSFVPNQEYTAKVRVTLDDATSWNVSHPDIAVDLTYVADSSKIYLPFQYLKTSDNLVNKNDYKDFSFKWKAASYNQTVIFEARVNPELSGVRQIQESKYEDNTVTDSLTLPDGNSTPPDPTAGLIFFTVGDTSTAANGEMTDKVTAANASLPDALNRYLPGSEVVVRIHIDPAGVQYDRFQIRVDLNKTNNPQIEIINNLSQKK
jgi:hypothetical protein